MLYVPVRNFKMKKVFYKTRSNLILQKLQVVYQQLYVCIHAATFNFFPSRGLQRYLIKIYISLG